MPLLGEWETAFDQIQPAEGQALGLAPAFLSPDELIQFREQLAISNPPAFEALTAKALALEVEAARERRRRR